MEAAELFTSTQSTVSLPNTTIGYTPSNNSLFTAKVVVQAIILALAIFGNACLLCVMRVRKGNFTRMQLFIIHLCFADMLVAFFNILPQLIWEIIGEWIAGDFMCRLVKFMQIFVMYLSTYILVLTALDRRRAICNPLTSHTWTSRLVNLSVGFVYALSAFLSVPQAIIFKYQDTHQGNDTKNCWVHFTPEWTLQLYITTFTVLVYIIPLIILIYAYVSIYYTIFKRAKMSRCEHIRCYVKSSGKSDHGCAKKSDSLKLERTPSNEKSKTSRTFVPRSSSSAGLTRAKLKTVKLTLVIIIAYLGCWSPFFISQLWWLYDEEAPANNSAIVIMLLLASLNSCCNPWIYMAFSGSLTFRGRLIICMCRKKKTTFEKGRKGYKLPLHQSTTKTTSIISTPVTPTTSKSILNGLQHELNHEKTLDTSLA